MTTTGTEDAGRASLDGNELRQFLPNHWKLSIPFALIIAFFSCLSLVYLIYIEASSRPFLTGIALLISGPAHLLSAPVSSILAGVLGVRGDETLAILLLFGMHFLVAYIYYQISILVILSGKFKKRKILGFTAIHLGLVGVASLFYFLMQ